MGKSSAPGSVGFDWKAARITYRRRLPHVVQAGTIYFITMRAADSIAHIKLEQWQRELEQWSRQNPPPLTAEQEQQYAELGYRRIERWLDRGEGSCVLKEPSARAAVEHCLRFGDGRNYWLGDFAVMPNHLHALVRPGNGVTLKKIADAWRTVSTQRVNKAFGRQGRLWQADSFDHIVRNQESLQRIRKYIQQNGKGLPPEWYTISDGTLFQ